jgi:membrane-associated phospholipid phosphatase
VAQEVLALRRHDGADQVVPSTIGTEPGEWQPTPPAYQQQPALPQWPQVTPFTMTSGSQFRPPAPPPLTSAEYTASFNEVKALGAKDSAVRTEDQTQIALFWINGPGTATPPGHWNEVAQVVAESQGNSLVENARLFALLNLAVADAGIVSWDAKYAYDLWRPVTAIRAADLDGNADTVADPDWTPFIVTPPFPAYTSGHSTFSAAAAAALADFFGRDDIAFTLRSETPDATDRSFASFADAAWESGVSRIYGGIHWNFDNVQGLATGEALGHFVVAHYLRPRSADEPGHPHGTGLSIDPGGRLSARGAEGKDLADVTVVQVLARSPRGEPVLGRKAGALSPPSEPGRSTVHGGGTKGSPLRLATSSPVGPGPTIGDEPAAASRTDALDLLFASLDEWTGLVM